MQCFAHPTYAAVGQCSCGRGVCSSCAVPFSGRIFCPWCRPVIEAQYRDQCEDVAYALRRFRRGARAVGFLGAIAAIVAALGYSTSQPTTTTSGVAIFTVLACLVGFYVGWAGSWGMAEMHARFFQGLRSMGFLLFLTIPIWLGVMLVVMAFGIVYGILGGALVGSHRMREQLRTLQA